MDVLLIEPYYGGSHRSFLEGLRRNLPFRFDLLSLPARLWKWRMRLGAPWFAQELRESGRRYDRIVVSSFLDVAAFRGLAPRWVRDVPLLTYFHENQAAYPVQVDEPRDLHFALTNLTTILASDSVAFNSAFNRDSFLDECLPFTAKARDMELAGLRGTIEARSRVLYPPVDFDPIDAVAPSRGGDGAPVILWAHRWEHDKDPEAFFQAVEVLHGLGREFRLVVMGEGFQRVPAVFKEAKARFADRILQWGFADGRDYPAWLRRSDIAVSTARHEFFGIGIVEAVRAGCIPCLPRRLVYPELFPDEFLYNDDELAVRLDDLLKRACTGDRSDFSRLVDPYGWPALKEAYEGWIRTHL